MRVKDTDSTGDVPPEDFVAEGDLDDGVEGNGATTTASARETTETNTFEANGEGEKPLQPKLDGSDVNTADRFVMDDETYPRSGNHDRLTTVRNVDKDGGEEKNDNGSGAGGAATAADDDGTERNQDNDRIDPAVLVKQQSREILSLLDITALSQTDDTTDQVNIRRQRLVEESRDSNISANADLSVKKTVMGKSDKIKSIDGASTENDRHDQELSDEGEGVAGGTRRAGGHPGAFRVSRNRVPNIQSHSLRSSTNSSRATTPGVTHSSSTELDFTEPEPAVGESDLPVAMLSTSIMAETISHDEQPVFADVVKPNRGWFKWAALLFVLLVAGVVTGIMVGTRRSPGLRTPPVSPPFPEQPTTDGVPSQSESPSSSPSSSPSMAPSLSQDRTELLDAFRLILPTNSSAFDDTSSYQYMAFELFADKWLASIGIDSNSNNTVMDLLNRTDVISEFVLGTLHFALGLSDSSGWDPYENYCSFTFIECNENGGILELSDTSGTLAGTIPGEIALLSNHIGETVPVWF